MKKGEGIVKKIHIHTFGCAYVGNQPPPSPLSRPWDLCLNAQHLRDPHDSGLNPATRDRFLTENSEEVEFIAAFAEFMVGLVFQRFDEAAIAINCKHGWARSVSLAEILAGYFREFGYEVEVVHLHHGLPPVESDCDG